MLFTSYVVNPDGQLILPQLEKFNGLGSYLQALLTLRTFDLQPVRDLTLAVDNLAWSHLHLNLAVWQNIFWWALSCCTLFKILKLELPQRTHKGLAMAVLLFAAYPLFVATLPWGMARKHILSALFTLLASYSWLKVLNETSQRPRQLGAALLCYILALASQPICILWPAWALLRAWPVKTKAIRASLTLSVAVLALGAWANSAYYAHSPTFHTYYASKTDEAGNISDTVLAFGHYAHQLFLPYATATSYDLGDASTLIGLGIALATGMLLWKLRHRDPRILSWAFFMVLPLFVVGFSPRFMSDSYLLLPAAGLLMIFVLVFPTDKLGAGRPLITAIALGLIWAGWTFKEARYWTDPLAFADQRNFQRRPSCDSAVKLALKEFTLRGDITSELRLFLMQEGCLKLTTPTANHALTALTLKSYMAFSDPNLPPEQKESILRGYGSNHHLPQLLLAEFYHQQGSNVQALAILREVEKYAKEVEWVDHRDEIISRLQPLCHEAKDKACESLVAHFTRTPDFPWL